MSYEAKTWYNEGKDSDGNVVTDAPKLDADNLNRIETGIKGAYDNIAAAIEELKNYQKPWNIEQNVVPICEICNDAYFDSRVTSYGAKRVIKIPMINSGRIMLKYIVADHNDRHDDDIMFEYSYVSLSLNAIQKKRYMLHEYGSNNVDGKYEILILDVNKGDFITLEVSIRRSYVPSAGSSSSRIGFSDLVICANADTPYKYGALKEVSNIAQSSYTEIE